MTPKRRDPPVERFHPTTGRVLGVLGTGGLCLGAVFTVVRAETLSAAAAAAALGWGALVVYVTLLRPTVHAYDDYLLLRNILRDIEVPWHLVDEVVVRQTTRVYVADDVHHGIGIGRSVRQMTRSKKAVRPQPFAGSSTIRGPDAGDRSMLDGHAPPVVSYPDYVEFRLSDLAKEQATRSERRRAVRRPWAVVETVGLLALTVVLAVLLALA